MDVLIAGLFTDSKQAGDAVSKLKKHDFIKDISIVAKDMDTGEINSEQIKEDITEGAAAGAVTGGIAGIMTGLLASLVTITLPGVGPVLVGGPLVAAWSLTGGAIGALAGGLIGGLVDLGFSQERAQMYKDHLLRGEVLVAVKVDESDRENTLNILDSYGVHAIDMVRL